MPVPVIPFLAFSRAGNKKNWHLPGIKRIYLRNALVLQVDASFSWLLL